MGKKTRELHCVKLDSVALVVANESCSVALVVANESVHMIL